MLALLIAAVMLQQTPEAPPPSPGAPAPAASAERQAPAQTAPRRAVTPPTPPTPPAPRAPRAGDDPLAGDWPAKPSGKRVTLDEEIMLDEALERISDAADWNVVLNTGRTGNTHLRLRLRDVPVEDALRAALAGTMPRLVATRRGDTVIVAPPFSRTVETPVLSGFEKPTGKRFTADFDETEADEALRQIADAAGLSIVIPPGSDRPITARFREVPVEEALKAVLAQAGLTAAREGSVITVEPGAPGFRGFPHGLSREARREAERAMREADREMARELGREPRGEKNNDRVVHGNVTIRAGEQVNTVVALRGSVKLEPGAEAHDVVAILGSITLGSGARANQAVAVGGDVVLEPGAEIENDAVSVGGDVRPDPSASIGGQVNSVGIPSLAGLAALAGGTGLLFGPAESPLFKIGQTLAKFALYFALGLILLALFPRRVDAVAASFAARPLRSILTGALGLVATPLVILLLVVTVIGILLVPVAVLMVAAAGVLGFTALSYYIGRAVPLAAARGTQVVQLAIGTAIVVLVTQIPFLGGMAWFAAALLTFGAVLRSRFGQHAPVLPTTVAPPPSPMA